MSKIIPTKCEDNDHGRTEQIRDICTGDGYGSLGEVFVPVIERGDVDPEQLLAWLITESVRDGLDNVWAHTLGPAADWIEGAVTQLFPADPS
jgi:hypothetical protein